MYRTRVHSGSKGRPTRDDVAREANISGATVSRVLSGRTDIPISKETRELVIKTAAQLGYRPNQMARALMTGRTGLVGFWMCLQYSRYRSQVLDCMRQLLGQTEMAMVVTDVDEEYHWDHSFSRALRVPADGIIAFDASASIDAFAEEYERLAPGTPFVSLGAYWSEKTSFVGVDLKSGALEAMDHLLAVGRRRIAYMAPYNSDLIYSGPRFEAYLEKMNAAGLPVRSIPIQSVTLGSIKETLAEVCQGPNQPDAIFCMNDDIAIAANFALSRLGIETGKDVALVGFDGIEETEHCLCPITTVRQPVQEMCALTIKFLQSQMEDPTGPLHQKILKPSLIIRDSTGGRS